MSTRPSEIIFAVEEAPEGGFVARALGHSVFTEADDLEALRAAVRDAVRCHFDDAERPKGDPTAPRAGGSLCGMRLPRDVSGRDLAKALGKLGYKTTRQTGSHIRLTTQQHGEHHITIPDHTSLSAPARSPQFSGMWPNITT